MDQALNSQKTSHTSPLRASYGMSFVSILMKNDRVIKGFYCNALCYFFCIVYVHCSLRLLHEYPYSCIMIWNIQNIIFYSINNVGYYINKIIIQSVLVSFQVQCHWMDTLKIHWNYTEMPLDGVHWNYTGITLDGVHRTTLKFNCTSSAPQMHLQCTPTASAAHPNCPSNTPQLHLQHIPSAPPAHLQRCTS